MPHLFVINKMDRPGRRFRGDARRAAERLRPPRRRRTVPLGSAENFHGYVDLAEMKALHGSRATTERKSRFPATCRTRRARMHVELLEAMADFDDHSDGRAARRRRAAARRDRARSLQRVLARSSRSGPRRGRHLRSRRHRRWCARSKNGSRRPPTRRTSTPKAARSHPIPTGPVIAHVIKTSIHPQSGKLSIARILSGTIKSRRDADQHHQARRKSAARRPLPAARQETRSRSPRPGPARSSRSRASNRSSTGDTLTSNGHKVLLAARPGRRTRLRRCGQTERAHRRGEDFADARAHRRRGSGAAPASAPTSRTSCCCSGSGEQHVSIAVERLARKYKVEVETAAPTIPYLETITGGTEIHSRYKHQTGGHGQFGDVWLRFEPRERGSGVTLRREDRRRRRAAPVHPGGRKGRARSAAARPERPSGHRLARHALRRAVSRRRFERAIVQDGGRHGRARGAAEMQSGRARADRPRGGDRSRRRTRRPSSSSSPASAVRFSE